MPSGCAGGFNPGFKPCTPLYIKWQLINYPAASWLNFYFRGTLL
jgi:hypothetical protein